MNDVVATGVATLVIHDKRLLLGRRLTNNQFTGWQCPGGYLHKGEAIEQAARRYCLQKAGIEIEALRPGPYSNNIFSEQLHTTTLYIIAEEFQIQNHKIFESRQAQWSWFSFDALPEKLFLPLNCLLKQNNLNDIREKVI